MKQGLVAEWPPLPTKEMEVRSAVMLSHAHTETGS